MTANRSAAAETSHPRIESPMAKYTSKGDLMCSLCGKIVRPPSHKLWNAHLVSVKHKEMLALLRESVNSKTEQPQKPQQPHYRFHSYVHSISHNSIGMFPTMYQTLYTTYPFCISFYILFNATNHWHNWQWIENDSPCFTKMTSQEFDRVFDCDYVSLCLCPALEWSLRQLW